VAEGFLDCTQSFLITMRPSRELQAIGIRS
jgi:hypothetical protein